MGKSYRHEEIGPDGWSRWLPAGKGRAIACCDCGLVHNAEARVTIEGDIELRFARNNRATGQTRRYLKKIAKT